jgi:hypothetical protein
METTMPRGGARPGAGRPKKFRGPQASVIQALESGSKQWRSALEFAMAYINSPNGDIEIKVRLAIAALPFMHPKIESIPVDGRKKERQAKAAAEIQAQPSPFAAPSAPRLVASRNDA